MYRLRSSKFLFVAILSFFGLFNAQGQSQAELNKKKTAIEKELIELNNLQKTIQRDKQSSEFTLMILNKKISSREQLINNIHFEIKKVNRGIQAQQNVIKTLDKDLLSLRKQYIKMLRYAYKVRKSTDRLIFLLSADNFNKAYKRWKYLKDLTEYRKKQAQIIFSKRKQLKKEIDKLEKTKQEKESLLGEENNEKVKLSEEKKKKEVVYEDLRKKQDQIKKQIKDKKKEADQLESAIKDIIAKETAKTKNKEGVFSMTPAEKELSQNFSANQKKFPWPVERGSLSQGFGKNKHQVFENIETNNNGIDIVSARGSKARAVFKGKVAAIIVLPGDKYAVLIKHGEYYTMYSNLDVVSVKKGDDVMTKEEIGTIKTNPEDGKTELHFEIWKGEQLLNPSLWLSSN
ncbi:MAG: peptidoglycan DD-metalloendopeptidase family protein [Bacteroidetes bacterium]|nr:peptidoglycan DD-metalloendopeptidase family protein [Bacteroidota bacterium]